MSFQKDVVNRLDKIEKEVATRLDKIESKLGDQTVHLAIYNKELTEHSRRSLLLEERVQPLEQSHVFTTKLLKLVVALLTATAALGATYHYLFTKP